MMPQNAQIDALAAMAQRIYAESPDAAIGRQRRRGPIRAFRPRVQAHPRRPEPDCGNAHTGPRICRGRQHGAALYLLTRMVMELGRKHESAVGKLADLPIDGRQSETALKIARGTRGCSTPRLLRGERTAAPSGRRADLVALGRTAKSGSWRSSLRSPTFAPPEVDGLPDALRPAVLCHHGRVPCEIFPQMPADRADAFGAQIVSRRLCTACTPRPAKA